MPELNQLLDAARNHRQQGRPDLAHGELHQALSLCREAGMSAAAIPVLKALAQIDRDLGNLYAAIAGYTEAIVLCREAGDSLVLAHTLRHLGDVQAELAKNAPAGACYAEAMALYRSDPAAPALDVANALRSYALWHDFTGLPEAARPLWAEAQALYQACGVAAGASECAARLKGD